MPSSRSQIEYAADTRIGEKGQLTIPKQYRDELGLETGAPVAVLRIGEALILVPEQNRFRLLCESIASVFEHRQIAPDGPAGYVARGAGACIRTPLSGACRAGAQQSAAAE